jgi:hypothetical protein
VFEAVSKYLDVSYGQAACTCFSVLVTHFACQLYGGAGIAVVLRSAVCCGLWQVSVNIVL